MAAGLLAALHSEDFLRPRPVMRPDNTLQSNNTGVMPLRLYSTLLLHPQHDISELDFWDKHNVIMACAGTLLCHFTAIFGDNQDLSLQAENGQFLCASILV